MADLFRPGGSRRAAGMPGSDGATPYRNIAPCKMPFQFGGAFFCKKMENLDIFRKNRGKQGRFGWKAGESWEKQRNTPRFWVCCHKIDYKKVTDTIDLSYSL